MSFKKSITNDLKNKISSKNIVLLKGNVLDFIFPKFMNIKGFEKYEKNYESITLVDYLARQLFIEHDIKNIIYASPLYGLISAENGEIKLDNDKNQNNNFASNSESIAIEDDNFEEPSFSKNSFNFSEFIQSIKESFVNSVNNKSKNESAYILDLSEFIFNDKNVDTRIEDIGLAINLFSDILNNSATNYINDKFKLIIIINNQDILNSVNFNNNVEFVELIIKKPNLEERKLFFKTFRVLFSELGLENSKELNNAVSLTDGCSYRMILQMLKLYEKNKKEIHKFKDLYRLFFFEEKDSKWEKMEFEEMKMCNSFFNERVKGQEEAISKLEKSLKRSFVGLQGIAQSSSEYANKPKGILFLSGPTGTGKTELVKALSEFIFKDQNKIIRFDMSEYNHDESDQKLIGAAPGYVGYENGGQLTNAVLEKPFSILLFDEIEKANGKILDKFLQILEDGRLTSAKGELVDFSETFIVFTSNIGASNCDFKKDKETIRKHFRDSVVNYFTNELNRPELLNRIGLKNIVPFNPILKSDKEICINILKSKFDRIVKNIYEKKSLKIEIISKENLDKFFESIINNYDEKMGGRGLVMTLEKFFIDPLSEYLFNHYEELSNISKDETKTISFEYDSQNKILNFKSS
ncbi:ATPase, T2SS/T4P/T4SS family [Mycoplasmopsis lipofaciens]|uniref:ATPase, T2SS/T4P/T4SS family n=1 Tax=Mycoplasmopsis lipofaciens TaxID=114884 RepID=UPI00068D138D|nr:AAA family ATPase [Mycoplasmopsis lipofaciens]